VRATTSAVTRSPITVRAALRLPALRRGLPEVMAGHAQLDRRIRWVHAGEVPNMPALLRGGELLLATGMGIGALPDDQRHFVGELASRGIAGLVIELGRVYRRLPDTLVTEAELRELPLIQLRREIPFVAVTEAMHTEIVNRHYALLERGEQIHRRFTNLMFDGKGVPDVLAALAETIANPLVLEDGRGRLLYHAIHHTGDAEVLAAWETVRASELAPACAPAAYVARPVPAGPHNPPGRLVALSLDSELDEFDLVAIERAVGVIGLALLRARQEEELQVGERGNFLVQLAEGRIPRAEAEERAETIGFVVRRPVLLPMVLRLRPTGGPENGAAPAAHAWARACDDIRRRLEAHGLPALIGIRPSADELLLLLAAGDAADRPRLADTAADAIHAAVRRRFGRDAVLVVADAAASLGDAGGLLRDAAGAVAAAAALAPRPWHDARSLELDRLLWRWRDDEEFATLVRRSLQPLEEHDRRRKHQLLPTLEALCAHGGRKAEAARALHLNRQGLYARIERIERLLGVDLSDHETMLRLDIALHARRHMRRS
jgi:purine catabolism regulator